MTAHRGGIIKSMEVPFMGLADYANVTREGKINVLGLFDILTPPMRFPYRHPQMFVIVTLSAGPAEFDKPFDLRVVLTDEDGKEHLSVGGQLTLGRPKRPGTRANHNQVIGLANLRIDHPGTYQFSCLINGEERRSVSLYVNPYEEADAKT